MSEEEKYFEQFRGDSRPSTEEETKTWNHLIAVLTNASTFLDNGGVQFVDNKPTKEQDQGCQKD